MLKISMMTKTITQHYKELETSGQIVADAQQLELLEKLDSIKNELETNPARWGKAGLWERWVYEGAAKPPCGVYFYGTVGRGKSMLMNLFFENVNMAEKRRVHFHSFMNEVHERMHHAKPEKGEDPVAHIAKNIAKDARLLCFDEFYISNIADAMMLGRLLEMLLKQGVVVFATSNWAPENLFRGGHNRVLFKPFIAMIEKSFDIFSLGEGQDWRLKNGEGLPYWFSLEQKDELERIFNELTPEKQQGDVLILHDKVQALGEGEGVLYVSFKELCGRAFSAEHYIEIANRFKTVILEDVPVFDLNHQDEAMRFVILVDVFYETGTHLICTAEDLPHLLCPEGESAFAFERTASRLVEMQQKLKAASLS